MLFVALPKLAKFYWQVASSDFNLQALQLVLGQASTPGSQRRSAFTAALATHSINATAEVLSDTPYEDDSIQDQIDFLTATPKPNQHLGAIIGSSVGSGVALLLLAAAFVVFGRGWLKKRQLQKRTAAWRKVSVASTALEQNLALQWYVFMALFRLWAMPKTQKQQK